MSFQRGDHEFLRFSSDVYAVWRRPRRRRATGRLAAGIRAPPGCRPPANFRRSGSARGTKQPGGRPGFRRAPCWRMPARSDRQGRNGAWRHGGAGAGATGKPPDPGSRGVRRPARGMLPSSADRGRAPGSRGRRGPDYGRRAGTGNGSGAVSTVFRLREAVAVMDITICGLGVAIRAMSARYSPGETRERLRIYRNLRRLGQPL